MGSHTVYISVGSNMGRKLENCRQGIGNLANGTDATLTAQSPFYRTAPVDFRDQDWFVNAVFTIQTQLSPKALLARLKEIQQDAGRKKSPIRFGPRVLDLDILLFDDLILSSSNLTIPHPRMHKRRFVLLPICDINPYLVHPTLKKEMRDLLASLDENDQLVTLIDD